MYERVFWQISLMTAFLIKLQIIKSLYSGARRHVRKSGSSFSSSCVRMYLALGSSQSLVKLPLTTRKERAHNHTERNKT